jgi:glycerophosphoryl diester phosphodiesterase
VVDPALEIIKKTHAMDRVCVASFSSKRLNYVRSVSPDLCISMGPKEVFRTLLSRYKLLNKPGYVDCLQVPMKYYGINIVNKKFVDYVQSKNIKIMVWTINDIKTLKYLIELNVDGIITDKPKLLFDLIKED